MTLATSLAPFVTEVIRDRGRDYFRSGAVSLDIVKPTGVAATVRGSARYDVDLLLEGRAVHASCSCSYGYEHDAPCKHIWATILAAEPRGFASAAAAAGPLRLVLDEYEFGEDEDDFPAPPVRAAVSPPAGSFRPAPLPGPRQETWQDQLAALRREVQPPDPDGRSAGRRAARELLFVVDATASEAAKKLVVEVNFQERKKNGDWSKPKAQHLSAADIDAVPDPLDRQIYALLSGAEPGDPYGYSAHSSSRYYGSGAPRFRLSGALLEMLLPVLARTGRVRLRQQNYPPVPPEDAVADLDPPWQLTVGIAASGSQWLLAGSLRRGDETMPLSAPSLIVPGVVFWAGRFARFDDAGAFAWVPTLRRVGSIAVPAAKADDLLGELVQMPSLPRLDLPEALRFTEEAIPPRPRLVVKASKATYGPLVLNAELSFEYGGIVVPARPVTSGVFQPDGRRFFRRDPVAERAADRELHRLGARPGYAANGGPTLDLKPTQLPGLVRELVAVGWRVEADGSLYRSAGKFELTVSSGQDWFDLNGTADFDGQTVAFPKLLEALRRGDASVVLDDGSLGMVPEEWLKKYGLLAQMGTVEGDAVRFSRAQAGVLDALLATRPEVTFDAQFARARDELQTFRGVAAADPPADFVGELREYQREGLGWLGFLRRFGFGGCLADDMGLGKTVQVLAHLAGLPAGKKAKPSLVVVPRSLIFNWKSEAARFAPKLKVLDHTGAARDRTGATFKNFDLVLTTYGTLRNDAEAFTGLTFDTCILDESQAAKNSTTETAKAVRLVRADHRLAMSGTPIENHLGELWTLFDFLNPGMLGRVALFSGAALSNPDPETRTVLAHALRPFILRRTKDQVAKDLPLKTEQTVYCDLGPSQRKLYDELRNHYRESLLARVDAAGLGRSKILVIEALLRLRQAACHPGLIDKARAPESSAKLDVLVPQLQELAESGRKALVFSQFTSLLAIVRARLDALGVTYEYLDGRTRDRADRVERFQTDPDCRLFLVSLKAGGVGLNLTAAEYVFLLDPWWNPAVEAQAIDRSHRIGQTKPVFAYRLIARNTVEEKVLALQQSKRELADAILGGDARLIADLKREDLELLLS
jgi:hypothetical protein